MTEEQASHVFERFYRTDDARTRARGGAGLGLAIAASLAAAHGGELTVDTQPGRGAAFHLRLPQPETFQVIASESQGQPSLTACCRSGIASMVLRSYGQTLAHHCGNICSKLAGTIALSNPLGALNLLFLHRISSAGWHN